MTVSKKMRFDVFKRDRFACQYCGRTPPAVTLEADHIIPKRDGGPDSIDNLLAACFDCNRGKGARPLAVVPDTLAAKMATQKERAEQLQAYNSFLMEQRNAEIEAVERIGLYWFNRYESTRDAFVFAQHDAVSVRRFLRDLPEAEILEAIDLTQARWPLYANAPANEFRNCFRYFCGICWNKIREASGGADAAN